MEKQLVWVGPRESDTAYSGVDFFKSITYNGTNQGGNTAFTSEAGTRINHILDGQKWHLYGFVKEHLNRLVADSDVYFLFYNAIQGYQMGGPILERTLCANTFELLDFFRSKANARAFAEEVIPVVPYVHFSGPSCPEVAFQISPNDGLILQDVCSSAGAGTHHFSLNMCKQFVAEHNGQREFIISPYLRNSIPINVHLVIFDDACIVLPPSLQLINHCDSAFSYIGGDFHCNFTSEQYDLILQNATALGEKMRRIGYRGVCGVDFLLVEDALYFLEVNARFQSSSFLLDKLLQQEGKPSLFQMNLMAFSGETPPLESFMRLQHEEGFFMVTGERCPAWLKNASKNTPSYLDIMFDGFSPDMTLTPKSYLCRIVSRQPLCWLSPEHQLRLAPNIQSDSLHWQNKIKSKELLNLKIGLLTQGVRFSDVASEEMSKRGNVRAGVFQSVDLTFPSGVVINSPYHTGFSELSPYQIEWDGSHFFLSYGDEFLSFISLASEDPLRNYTTQSGMPFRNATFLSTDRLRVHHELRCHFKETGNGCHFCNATLKSGNFSMDDVFEVVDYYLDHISFRHFLIGGGSGTDEEEPKRILSLAQHIRSKSDKPIYAMCLPPQDTSILEKYYEVGINEIGFNLELFDRIRAKEIMPGKGAIPFSRYEEAYKTATRLWGKNGAVRSLLVLGLEPLNSFYAGVEWLCKLGVMPIISVFRPVNNIKLSGAFPPCNQELEDIFFHATAIAKAYGLVLGPICVACQNNTLSVPL